MLTANIRAFILLILRGFGDANLISQRDHLIALAAEKRITRSDKGAYAPILNGCKSLLKIISGRDSQHHELAPQPVRSCRDVLNVELNVRIGRVDQEADGLGRRCHLVKQLKLLGFDFPGPPCRHHRPLSAVIRRSIARGAKQRQAHRAFHIALKFSLRFTWLLKVQLIKLGRCPSLASARLDEQAI